jgi:membrane protein implicated in regulation of membrane protease activity
MYRAPTGGAAGAAGGLAYTGANLTWWIALAIVLVVAGLLMLRAARRRGRSASDGSDAG